MSDWISLHDLLNNWGIEKFEVVEYLKKGLQPYERNSGRPLNCPPDYHLGHIKQFLAALATPVGLEILNDAMMTIEDKIALIFAEKDTPSDRAEWRVMNTILEKWQLKAAKDGIKLNEFGELSVALKESAEKELEVIKKDDSDFVSWKWIAELSDDDLKELFSYLDEAIFKSDDVLEFDEKYKPKPREDKTKDFPCKPGTRWEDIKITLINDKMVEIETPQKKGR